MPKFSERNPVPIAAIGILVLVLAITLGLTASRIPLFAGSTYQAEFVEAGGLQANDVVRVAGVNVGSVSSVELDGPKVVVSFNLKEVELGDQTRAAIKTQTLLGQRFLSIEPAGTGELENDVVPLARTQAPYSITDAVDDLTSQTSRIDTKRVAAALDAASGAFANTPDDVTATLDGISRISQTISSRNDALLDLLKNANGTTAVLRDRSAQFVKLVDDANLLLGELERRRQEIRTLFSSAQQVFVQVRGLIEDNRQQIAPVLDRTNVVLANLQRNDANIQTAIKNLSVFARTLGEAVNSGPLFMAQVQNLVPTSLVGTDLGDLVNNLASSVPGGSSATTGLRGLLAPNAGGGNR